MGSVPSSATLHQSSGPSDVSRREDFGPIDASLRGPVALLVSWSAIWLILGLCLELIAAWKLHTPSFLAGHSWLTYGRVDAAASDVLLYGWGFNAALAVGFWLLGRLSGAPVRSNPLGFVAILFWNFAVIGGLGGILLGDATSLESLQFPGYVTPVLLVSFITIGVWLLMTLRDRKFASIFIGQWYIVGGLFWFAWLYSAAQLMLVFFPVRGTVQAIIDAWYSHGLLTLWFGSIALAALYYFIPKISGRPIRNYHLATWGFWSFAVVHGFVGAQRLIGGPVPAWVGSVGVAASVLSLFPLAVISVTILGSLGGALGSLGESAVLRFLTFAAIGFFAYGVQLVWNAIGSSADVVHLTFVTQSQSYLAFFGFFTMAALGALYYIVPRIAGKAWSSPSLINVHFFASALGVLLVYGALLFGGFQQGEDLANPSVRMLDVVQHLMPALTVRTVGVALILIGQIAFLVNLGLTLAPSMDEAREPVTLPEPPEMEAAR